MIQNRLTEMKSGLKSHVIMHNSQHYRSSRNHNLQQNKPLARSRSLKELFGDLPIIQHHMRLSKANQDSLHHSNPFKMVDGDSQEVIKVKNKKKNDIINSQYHMQSKINKKCHGTMRNTEISDKKHLNLDQQAKKQHKTSQSNIKKYNPNVYSWRKSLSRDKQNLKNNKKDGYKQTNIQLNMVQSQYYEDRSSKRQSNVFKQVQVQQKKQKDKSSLKTIRSCSQQFYINYKSNCSSVRPVRPKVYKNVFEHKLPKSRSLLKKQFLYTFGI